jgi:hypothetical protein
VTGRITGRIFGAAVLVWAAGAGAAHAQTPRTPSDAISFLVTNQSVSTGDFQKDQAAAAATRDTIARALLVNLATVPIQSSSSGFLYRLDPELGTMERASQSFGTFLVERAATSGRGRSSFGVATSTTGFDRLDGHPLRDGSLVTTANQFRDEKAPFDVESLTLNIRTSTLTLFGTYGITDRLEIAGAVPFVRLHLEGRRVNVYRGAQFVQATAVADASGLADVAVRGKFTALRAPAGSVAVAAELRLPTGDDAALLGAGRTGFRMLALGSFERGAVGLHGNAGIAAGGASGELDAAGALTLAVTPKVSAIGEVFTRRLSDLKRVEPVSVPHPLLAGIDTLRLVPGTSTTVVSTAVSGIKWNVRSTLVVGAQVLWRLGSGGLTARATPAVSIDYLF